MAPSAIPPHLPTSECIVKSTVDVLEANNEESVASICYGPVKLTSIVPPAAMRVVLISISAETSFFRRTSGLGFDAYCCGFPILGSPWIH